MKSKNVFFNDFNLKRGFFSPKTFLSDKRIVCIQHKDGRVTEHPGITDPWRYIVKVKKQMDVINAWIKDE
jgi:hypothetical protein